MEYLELSRSIATDVGSEWRTLRNIFFNVALQ